MRSKPTLFCALLWVMAIAVFAGCNKSASVEDFNQAFVESRDEGTIAWNIRADGTVKAMLKSREDKAIVGSMSGKIATDGAPVELTPIEGTGVLEGKGQLKLGADLTRAKYDLLVEGKSWEGTLFLPSGGTADLVASAFPLSWVFGRSGCSLAHDHPGMLSNAWFAVQYPGGGRFDLGLIGCEYYPGFHPVERQPV